MSAEQVTGTGSSAVARPTAPSNSRARIAPGPRGPFSGFPLLRNPLPFIEKLFREYGDVVRARFLNFPVYIVAHPDGVKHVLQENHRNYVKSAGLLRSSARCSGQDWSPARARCGCASAADGADVSSRESRCVRHDDDR